ncbi:hypothetical protein [Sphingorhabdus sp. Alg239-R122]|uniref:hypothetical protein n=1 Tax=Sphingorhabdus sp. Alg239-R122 TaxID=2305989 RepID=UPI0013D945A7|nr:hypothetical protein [Sphingorhabdus sp. Alg239-R122]
MIASVFLLFAAQAVDTLPEPVYTDEEIVIIGRRMQGISVNVGRDPQGSYHCSLNGSTGYPRLDEKLCKATTKCVRKGNIEDAAVKQCLKTRKSSLLKKIKRKMRRDRK